MREHNRCYGPAVLAVMGGGALLANSMRKKESSAAAAPVQAATPTVADAGNTTDRANNLGRAALISTSSQGILGSDPTGRRKLLGN